MERLMVVLTSGERIFIHATAHPGVPQEPGSTDERLALETVQRLMRESPLLERAEILKV